MKNTKRSGFTLVELLIVIVVIGVLSAMMMLSSTEAVSSAKAADIISDLRNLKTAALAWYADNLDYVDNDKVRPGTNVKFSNLNTDRTYIAKYLGNGEIKSEYLFSTGKDVGTWFAYTNVKDSKVFDKLKSRAGSVGLCLLSNTNGSTSADLASATYNNNTNNVALFIR